MTNKIELLFEKVGQISAKYDGIFYRPSDSFNIFTILRQEDDEVNLHSRFLAELLSPSGTHRQGYSFLDLFLKRVGVSGFELKHVYVKQEYHCIDILIANETQTIIIENKIHAQDQYHQLERYYRDAVSEGLEVVAVIYLTLYGDEPSDHSAGNLDKAIITSISYKHDIHTWVEQCVESVTQSPAMKEALIQYSQLVERLTGQCFKEKYIMDIKTLLKNEKNLALAASISQAFTEAKIEVQFSFWQELEAKLVSEGYSVIEHWKYSRSKVERLCLGGAGDYGIMFELRNLKRKNILAFFIGVWEDIYYGFVVLPHGRVEKSGSDSRFDYLAQIIETATGEKWEKSDWMIAIRRPSTLKAKIDFCGFGNADTFALVTPSKRTEYVNGLIGEVKRMIDLFNQAHEKAA